jgi:hypothetical protein
MPSKENGRALSAAEIASFIETGFVRIDDAFPSSLATQARDVLWQDLHLDPDDPSSWTQPVVRLGVYSQPPFIQAAATARLAAAYDELAGPGRWVPVGAMGTFPVRFPSPDDPGDAGWHVDVSFGFDAPNFLDWRANVRSRGRWLLMLFLFSDVGERDAPTRIRIGSHVDMARLLAPAGEDGMTLGEMVAADFGGSASRPETLATGPAGTVYLCHPLLLHSAQPHRGTRPRFMAQPPLLPRVEPSLERADGDYSVVRRALGL